MSDYKGKLVVVEGIDKAGKTSLVDRLDQNMDIVRTQEPSQLDTGHFLRDRLIDESSDPLADYFAFLMDRREHIEQIIKPALRRGDLVISDRFSLSTRCYQPIMLEDILDFPTSFIDTTMKNWEIEPDLTLFLDVSIDTSLVRMDGNRDKYEKRETLERVRKNYEGIISMNQYQVVRIDGEQIKDDVLQDAIDAIRQQTS